MVKIYSKAGIIAVIAAIIIASAALSLFTQQQTQPPKADDSGSTQQGIQQVVDANNQFAFEIYSGFDKKTESNIFYSPYSISAALAMTYEGAKGETADEMKAVFHFPESTILRPNFAAIYNGINTGNKEYELRTANALWAQYNYQFLEDYTSRVEQYYGGKATNLDFVQDTENSRQTINSYIEQQTNDRIKDLIPQGILGSMTRIVITNAIYFKGKWEWEFDKSDTNEQDFRITPNNSVKAQMMYMDPEEEARFNYADLEKLQILELPYKGEEISMLILLPKQGEEHNHETRESTSYDYTLEDIELSYEKFNEYKAQMQETNMDSISIPKFEFDTKYFMKETLIDMGMPTAFGNADFSGMDGTKNLQVSQVIHQAFIKVDEKGTEAAAATAVAIKESISMPRNVFRADHPFVFIIQERDTGNILFMGRVMDPSQK